ncbi:sugar kinase [bacterium]|nr:MAG: sugar kinase [bacterium]
MSLGIHIVDLLGRPVSIIPKGQGLTLIDEIRITVAGTAAGTAVDLAKLGMDVVAMGAIGTDELGNFVINTMQRYGIDTSCLVRKSNVQTSSTMLPIRPNGERPALHVIGANGELGFDDLNLEAIASASYLHMGGTSLLSKLDGEPTVRALKYAKDHGVVTTFDQVAINRPDLLDLVKPCMPYVDYFMPGFEEAQMMCGMTDLHDVTNFFLDAGAKHVVFKMGGDGSFIGWRENGSLKEIRLPIFKATVVDSTGCGDSYCAGFITGLSMGWDLEKAALLGTACGALVIQGLGSDAGIQDLESTIAFMNQAERLPITF